MCSLYKADSRIDTPRGWVKGEFLFKGFLFGKMRQFWRQMVGMVA